jgi:hypothetical protein
LPQKVKAMTKIRTLAATLLVAVAMLPSAAFAQQNSQGGGSPVPVIVTNPPTAAANSFIVNPADLGDAVAHALGVGSPTEVDFTWSISGGIGTPYTVPAGQRLVVETVTGLCQAENAFINGLAIGGPHTPTQIYVKPIYLISVPQGAENVGTDPVFNYSVKVSYPGGTVLNLIYTEAGGGGNAGGVVFLSCHVSVYGQSRHRMASAVARV